MALATTTIGVVLAAGVALVVLRLTLGSTRIESGQTDARLAIEAAEQVRIEFESELATSPLFFYSYVSTLERARVCTEDDDRVVQPGQPWPTVCGTSWGYTTPDTPGTSFVELTPPSSTDPRLSVVALATRNQRQLGTETFYVLDSTARYTLASIEDLDLGVLPGGASSALSGELYAGGSVDLGRVGYQVDRLSVVAEGGYVQAVEVSPLVGGAVRLFGPEDLSGEFPVRSARTVRSVPLSNLQALYPTVANLACQAQAPTLADGRATGFCLVPGAALVDVAGDLVAVPAADRFLLLPGVGGAGRIGVYWSATEAEAPETCSNPCNPAAASSAALAANTHPGGLGYWTSLGSFPAPANGLVYTSEDVHIGLCGSGFTGAGCTVWSGATGVEADVSLTVFAGSVLDPSDVYVSGPVTVADGASFGAVASGRVLLPYWATTPGGAMRVGGSYAALGVGAESADSVATIPEAPSTTVAGALLLDGGFAGVRLDTSLALFSSVDLAGRAYHYTNPPPLYPTGDGTWVRMESRRYRGFDHCGTVVCGP